MEERTTGLILRTRPLTETSLIVQWLTADFGRISTVAKGARRPKSSFSGKLDLFYLAELSFVASRRSDLHTLREVNVKERHPALRTDLHRLEQAAYFVQLLEQTTESSTPLPGYFDLLASALTAVSERPVSGVSVFAFELKLLGFLGLAPAVEELRLTSDARGIVDRLSELDWLALAAVQLSGPLSDEIDRFLHGYLIYHLERVPKGRRLALRTTSGL